MPGSLLLFIVVCAFASDSAAQQLSVSGTVRDNAGVIPGATVVLSSGGNQIATVTTNESGSYRFRWTHGGERRVDVLDERL